MTVCRLTTLRSLSVATLMVLMTACARDPQAAKQRRLESADKYMAAGNYAEAIIEYRNALQQDGNDGHVHAKLAATYLQIGDFANGLRECVRAADLLPDDAQLQLKTANLLLLANRFDDAKARAEKVLAKDTRNVDAEVAIANALAGLKDVDGAIAQVEDALQVDPERSGTYTHLGALELSRGKQDAAERAFKKAVEVDPRSIAANLALGNFYWLTRQVARAEDSLKQALDLDPRNALTNRALSSFYLATNRADRAELPLKAVLEVTKTPTSAFALAEYYIALGKEAEARAILQPMLDQASSSNEAEVRLAALDYKSGQHDAAYRRLERVLGKDQGNLKGLLLKSSLLLADRKLDEALVSATTATVRDPESSSAFFTLGRVQAARRQPEAAIAAFQEVLRLNPRATDAKIALSQMNLSQGRPDVSIALAQEALVSDPNNAEAQLVFVRGLLTRGELDRADAELKRLVARFPDSSAVHTQMGMLLGRKREMTAAQTELERALELQPDNVEALGGLVALDLTKRDFKSARARVDARIAAQPTPTLLTLGARAYAAGGDLGTAEMYLRRAIELDSGNLAAYSGLGQLYLVQKKLDLARTEFETLAARAPKSVAAWTMVGIILQAQGDVKSARERFERVMEIDPEAAVAANNLAWIYAETGGNLDQALQLAQTAQKHLPGAAEVSDTLGFVYYKKNLAPLAISPLKASAEKDPSNPLYQYHLGLAYASVGDPAHARQSLTKALELKPDFDGAQEARNLLSSIASR
jgi:putative PEP-CTERM system TPR-repeat lipoprotein